MLLWGMMLGTGSTMAASPQWGTVIAVGWKAGGWQFPSIRTCHKLSNTSLCCLHRVSVRLSTNRSQDLLSFFSSWHVRFHTTLSSLYHDVVLGAKQICNRFKSIEVQALPSIVCLYRLLKCLFSTQDCLYFFLTRLWVEDFAQLYFK